MQLLHIKLRSLCNWTTLQNETSFLCCTHVYSTSKCLTLQIRWEWANLVRRNAVVFSIIYFDFHCAEIHRFLDNGRIARSYAICDWIREECIDVFPAKEVNEKQIATVKLQRKSFQKRCPKLTMDSKVSSTTSLDWYEPLQDVVQIIQAFLQDSFFLLLSLASGMLRLVMFFTKKWFLWLWLFDSNFLLLFNFPFPRHSFQLQNKRKYQCLESDVVKQSSSRPWLLLYPVPHSTLATKELGTEIQFNYQTKTAFTQEMFRERKNKLEHNQVPFCLCPPKAPWKVSPCQKLPSPLLALLPMAPGPPLLSLAPLSHSLLPHGPLSDAFRACDDDVPSPYHQTCSFSSSFCACVSAHYHVHLPRFQVCRSHRQLSTRASVVSLWANSWYFRHLQSNTFFRVAHTRFPFSFAISVDEFEHTEQAVRTDVVQKWIVSQRPMQ